MANSEFSRRFVILAPVIGAIGALTACTESPERTQKENDARQERIRRYLEENARLETLPYESPLIGGNWQDPPQNAVIRSETFQLATEAFAAEGAPPITYVALTANLPPEPEFIDLQNPTAWRILDVFPQNPSNRYALTVDLNKLKVPNRADLKFGCDVVNDAKQIKESPNGTRTVLIRR